MTASYKPTKKEKKASKVMYVHDKPLIVHKSGNSNVVTLPAALPYEPGDEFEIEEVEEGLLLKPVENTSDDSEIEQRIKDFNKIVGIMSTPSLKGKSIEDLEKELETVYD